ncbi:hypothetical protein HPP92_026616 [Vanilla planifolia]|uniref:RING-type E3 ubiquitin transferase n=1 Tax=Vanilla planifolia TaxID=51239 RepID=A0A835U6S6_VANPL|nr:hypothetical protein HPP92_026616 [Vanilla planifolia]
MRRKTEMKRRRVPGLYKTANANCAQHVIRSFLLSCQRRLQILPDVLAQESSDFATLTYPMDFNIISTVSGRCFADHQQSLVEEVTMLLDYVTMNAIAIRKILKKYDKVHGSVNGRNFKAVMRAKRIELVQSPWLIELGAFYLNCNGLDAGEPGEFFRKFSCDLDGTEPVMTMILSNSIAYEYSLICPICLDTLFNPYALGCGHLFCKSCVCAAASVLICDGPRSAPIGAKCPVCREVGVYRDTVHMLELDHLLRSRGDYWKQRHREERAEMVKQAKQYWEKQTHIALGY